MGIHCILSLTGKNAEVSRKKNIPGLPRMHLKDCIMIIMNRRVQSAGSGGHAGRHGRENVILATERLSNTCTFDITAAVSYPSKTFFITSTTSMSRSWKIFPFPPQKFMNKFPADKSWHRGSTVSGSPTASCGCEMHKACNGKAAIIFVR